MLRAYKYLIYPTKEQTENINQHIWGCRFVYNWALEQKIKYFETSKEKLSVYELDFILKGLKAENPWLKCVNSQSLQQANKNMESAFTKFFREKKRFPKFKSKKNPVQSFQISQHYLVDFEKGIVKLPKIGNVKLIVLSRIFEGTKTATVSRSPTGKYFIFILVDNGKDLPEKLPFNENLTIRIDLGLKDSAILVNGGKFENTKFLKNPLKRLNMLSRRLSRRVKHSINWKKAKFRLSRLHEKITNQRDDFHHKLTKSCVREPSNSTRNIKCMWYDQKSLFSTVYF